MVTAEGESTDDDTECLSEGSGEGDGCDAVFVCGATVGDGSGFTKCGVLWRLVSESKKGVRAVYV